MSGAEGCPPPGLESLARYRAMRDTAPVWRDPETARWHVYRYLDVTTVLTDHRAFSSDLGGARPRSTAEGGGVGTVDPPRHQPLRRMLSQAFDPPAIGRLETRVHELVGALLDRVRGASRIELMSELAHPLPAIVIGELLGVPPEDSLRLKVAVDGLLDAGAAERRESPAARPPVPPAAVYRDCLREHLSRRRDLPRTDLLSRLAGAEPMGRRLGDDEVVGLATELMIAGQVTTTSLLGSAALCLDEWPDAQEVLRADPGRIPLAVEEVLRHRSPVVHQERLATREVRLSDRTIEPGQVVSACLLSANHDERQFPAADRFVHDRRPNAHVGFGRGIHFCLGAHLARLEARVALGHLLRRYSRVRVDPERPAGASDWREARVGSTTVQGLARLHLLVEPS